MANIRKIITLLGQKHNYKNLGEIFIESTEEEKEDIIKALGLDEILVPGGGLIPKYSLDITSDKPLFITKDFDITLSGQVYNFFESVPDSSVTKWTWTRDSGDTAADTTWALGKNTKKITLSVSDFPGIAVKDITFSLTAQIGERLASDTITFSKSQILSKLQIKSTAGVFLDNTPDKAILSAESDAVIESYAWYLNNIYRANTKEFRLNYSDVAPGTVSEIKLEVVTDIGENLTDTISIPRVKNGVNGVGVPGPAGQDGESTYTWVKYADDVVGTNMSDLPIKVDGESREYLGLAPNKNTPVESDNYLDYTWSKYIGESSLMWVKYSIYYNGRDTDGDVNMQDAPYTDVGGGVRENMVYMGIAYNQTTTTESNIPEDYLWSKVLGDDGHSGYTLELSNDNISIPALGDGTIPNPTVAFSLATTDVDLYYGNDLVDEEEYTITYTTSPGLTVSGSFGNHTIRVTGMTADVGEVVVKARAANDINKVLNTATFSISKVRGSSSYEILASSSVIKVNSNAGAGQTVDPVSINVKVQINTGETVSDFSGGTLTYRYLYAGSPDPNPDGTPYDRINPFIINNDGDPIFLEFKFFHPNTGALVDIERIPFVRDGVNGLTVEFRYRKNTDPLVAPSLDRSDPNPTGWTIAAPTMDIGDALWMTKVNKYQQGGAMVGQWDIPVRVSGTPGSAGEQGLNGTTGPSPRLLEFVPGASYENGDKYIDYAYFRSSNTSTEGWYTVKLPTNHTPGTKVTVVYPGGIPDVVNSFVKAPFTKEMSFGTVVAEQANLAGFLFRNQVLQSQSGSNMAACHPDSGQQKPNLSLDGLTGIIKFLDRMVMDKTGIILKDDCGVRRMAFQWGATGIPILKFFAEDGITVTWEAGQNGYQQIIVIAKDNIYTPVNLTLMSADLNVVPTTIPLDQSNYYYCKDEDNNYTFDSAGWVQDHPKTSCILTRGTDVLPNAQPNPIPITENYKYFKLDNKEEYIVNGWYIEERAFVNNTSVPVKMSAQYIKIVNGVKVDYIMVSRALGIIKPCVI